MKYIGIDMHPATFTVSILDQDGDTPAVDQRQTSARNLIDLAYTIGGRKKVVVEESGMAGWVYRTLHPHVEDVIVADPRRNHWIARDHNIDDEKAAVKLAKLLRAGLLHPIHHPLCIERQAFKQLVQSYHDHSHQITRFKNKVKASFLQYGLPVTGQLIYHIDNREQWLQKLPHYAIRLTVEQLYATVDILTVNRKTLRDQLEELAADFDVIDRFENAPGIGFIRAATFFAFIDTPHRFDERQKVWTYCGLGIDRHASGQSGGRKRLTNRGNRTLKNMAKAAAMTAISSGGDNQFRAKYYQLIEDGTSAANAWSTVARKMVSTLWAMWRKDEGYNPHHDNSQNH